MRMVGEWIGLEFLAAASVTGDESLSRVGEVWGASPADVASAFASSTAATFKALWRLGFSDLGLAVELLRRWPATVMSEGFDQQGI